MVQPQLMNPWMPITDIRLCAILNKGGEELNELGKALCRTLMQGLDGTDPKTNQINLLALKEEMADVRGLISAICEELGFDGDDQDDMAARAEQKEVNVFAWLELIAPRVPKPMIVNCRTLQTKPADADKSGRGRQPGHPPPWHLYAIPILSAMREAGVPLKAEHEDALPSSLSELVNLIDNDYGEMNGSWDSVHKYWAVHVYWKTNTR